MADGVYSNGATYGPGASFGDGCVFINCTFYRKCTFGTGCHFINCTFMWTKHQPNSVVGPAAHFINCTLQYVIVNTNSIISTSSFGPKYTPIGDITVDGEAVARGGGVEVKSDYVKGAQVSADKSSTDWCKWPCEVGRHTLRDGAMDGHVSGNDNGKEWEY